MTPTAVALVLLSAAIHVGWNALAKASRAPILFLGLKGVWLLGIGGVFLVTMPLEQVPLRVWQMALLSGVIHAFYALSLGRAYGSGDISYVYPIARSAPAFIPLAAYLLLDESLSASGFGGISLVVVGVVWMQSIGLESGLAGLVNVLGRPAGRWALFTLLSTVAYSIVDKAGMEAFARVDAIHASFRGPLYFILENSIAYVIYLGVLVLRARRDLFELAPKEGARAFWAALGTLASYSLVLYVLETEALSYVVAVRQSSVLIAPLVGWALFREDLASVRLWPAVLIFGGVAVVAAYG